jgi:hypothetical protein
VVFIITATGLGTMADFRVSVAEALGSITRMLANHRHHQQHNNNNNQELSHFAYSGLKFVCPSHSRASHVSPSAGSIEI